MFAIIALSQLARESVPDWASRERIAQERKFMPALNISLYRSLPKLDGGRRLLSLCCLLCLSFFVMGTPAAAQESTPGSALYVTKVDSESAPIIELQTYGIDEQGLPLNISAGNVALSHGGTPASDVSVARQEDAGFFAIFILDTPPGVADQLDAVNSVISEFAQPTLMVEQLDYAAVYRVGVADAIEQVAPTPFHNSLRNIGNEPLPLESGPTALLDSLGNLLTNLENIKPKPELATAIVLMTDGTDVISSQFSQDQVVTLALTTGTPIHTIHLANADLGSPEVGRDMLTQLSQSTRGATAVMGEANGLGEIWSRITGLRSRTVLQYTIPQMTGGVQPVILSIVDDPNATTVTSVEVAGNAPSVAFDFPPEDRNFVLASLDETVNLKLGAAISWLDDQERNVSQAQLFVNDLLAQDIPPDQLEDFEVEVSQLQYGQNSFQLIIVDEQGMRGASPKIIVDVVEGEETIIPDGVRASSGLSRALLFGLICLGLLALIGGALWFLSRREFINLERSFAFFKTIVNPPRRRKTVETEFVPENAEPTPPVYEEPLPATAYLEPVESVSHMPQYLPLQPGETRIGRSPAQCDIAFENDITVSRLHAVIIFTEGEYRLYDEGSSSGTLVNDQPIPEYGAALIDGDEIRFGAVRTLFRAM